MNKTYDIQRIIKGCKEQDALFQKQMVVKFSNLLFAVCIRYVGTREHAQDVVQEAFIRIFKAIKNFDPEKGRFESWIRKITVNECLKHLDKRKIKTLELTDYAEGHERTNNQAISKLNKDDLLEVVAQLPDGYRQVFNLSVIEGYNHKEIGEMLGIKEVSSRSNLSRAKVILRDKLLSLQKQESWVKTI